MKANRNRLCKVCKRQFTVFNSMQKVCSTVCALEYSRQEVIRKQKREIFRQKKALREESLSWWHKKAQPDFNRWIRWRDRDLPCISCGKTKVAQFHAGHYRSSGNNGSLRYTEINVHKQCSVCNQHRSGHLELYRHNLIKKIGVDQVEWLEGPHEVKKWTIEEVKEIRRKYRMRLRDAGAL